MKSQAKLLIASAFIVAIAMSVRVWYVSHTDEFYYGKEHNCKSGANNVN